MQLIIICSIDKCSSCFLDILINYLGYKMSEDSEKISTIKGSQSKLTPKKVQSYHIKLCHYPNTHFELAYS